MFSKRFSQNPWAFGDGLQLSGFLYVAIVVLTIFSLLYIISFKIGSLTLRNSACI